MQIQRARPEDAAPIRAVAVAAYTPYIRRIGRKPAPMLADFPALIAANEVWALAEIAEIIGYVVLRRARDSLHVENIAVHPERHGEGHGRALLDFAEAEADRRGLARLDLHTNAAMAENLSLYANLGWTETGRRRDAGFDRVYFTKPVSPRAA